MPELLNITNLPSSRVEFIDPRTGLMSREWYRFFLNLFTLTGGGNNQTSLDDLQLAPPPIPNTNVGGGSGTVTSVDMTVPTGLSVSGNPITTSGTLAVTYAAGYSIPTTISQTNWDTAYTERLQWDGGATNLVPATGRTSLGSTTIGDNLFTLVNPSAITFPQFNADNTVSALSAAAFRAAIGAGTGSGSVTSVDATVPSFLSVTGGPITSSGTLAIAYSGTALPVANGGTGQITASAAFNALSPITATGDLIIGNGTNSATRLAIGANNYVLTSNGTTAVWAVASGSGATITNDTTTATNVYPTFAAATSGSLATIYTGDTKLLYKPSTGEFTSSVHISSNGIQVNSKTVSTSYTIATGNSGVSAGPITIASGKSVTVSSGSRWVIL
jgi:hypothetical protein